MSAAAVGNRRGGCAWDYELSELDVNGHLLPVAAQVAICGVLDSVIEDGALDPRQAQAAHALRDKLGEVIVLTRARCARHRARELRMEAQALQHQAKHQRRRSKRFAIL
ncbi:MAG TPA: hypothetical protein VGL76_02960 [Gaiellaceae bacterium]|jgi:hypothetical protein